MAREGSQLQAAPFGGPQRPLRSGVPHEPLDFGGPPPIRIAQTDHSRIPNMTFERHLCPSDANDASTGTASSGPTAPAHIDSSQGPL